MENCGDGANGDRATAWPVDELSDGGARALARLIGRPQAAPRAASMPLAAVPIGTRVLGGAYGASWRDSPDILFALRLTADSAVFDAINPACAKSLGVRSADVVGRSPKTALSAAGGCRLLAACLKCAALTQSARFVHPMGRGRQRRDWDTVLTPICGEDGAAFLILGRSRPVAEEGGPQDAIERLAAVQTAGGDAVEMALLDRDGVIISVNSAWRETVAALRTDAKGSGAQMPYEEVCRRIVPDLDPSVLHRAMRDLLAGRVRSLTHAYVVVSSGRPRWRQIRVSQMHAGVAHFIAVHEDLTELDRAQAELRRTTEQLLSAQQDERERIAVALHGSTGEYLAELGTRVTRLRRLMSDNISAQDILDDVDVSLKEATREIRVMSNLMKPRGLSRHGLETAARRFVKEFATRTGLKTVFRSDGPVDRASGPIQHAAFRVVQEALSNVHRHAHANGVEVELASDDDDLTLRIADDGRGFAALRQAYPEGIPPGVGIPGMRSRVEELGGSMEVDSDRFGTVVAARIPLAHSQIRL